jgi:hypothetical protein
MDIMLLSKETLKDQHDALKVAWENEFTETIGFFEEEVEKWLVKYINRNDEVDDTLHESCMDMREFENEFFEIKTRHEITVSPMKEYIEEWFKKVLIKTIQPENQETVAAVMPPQSQHAYTKEPPPSK